MLKTAYFCTYDRQKFSGDRPHSETPGAPNTKVLVVVAAVENVAYGKESWINNRRQLKRHVRRQWSHGQASLAVDGDAAPLASAAARGTDAGAGGGLRRCTVLDNFYVEHPVWMVDLGTTMHVSGVVILTWTTTTSSSSSSSSSSESTRRLSLSSGWLCSTLVERRSLAGQAVLRSTCS